MLTSNVNGSEPTQQWASPPSPTDSGCTPLTVNRSYAEAARFVDGLELVDPGLVRLDTWHATPDPDGPEIILWGGVGRKP
jgi:hypothetical protein